MAAQKAAFPRLEGRVLLAPMAGITDAAFRLLCRRHGAAMCFTEMISASALARMNQATLEKIDTCEGERPVALQLFGQDTESIVQSAEYIKEKKLCDVIDFNIGCPAAKIIRQGAGSALLLRPNRIREIIEKLAETGMPISVKTRLGIRKGSANVLKIAKLCEEAGACALTVHARYQKQGYTGKADWSFIKEAKDSVSIPIIGNGDIASPEDAKRMLDETGCDYVMIGRAARGNPLLFGQCNEYLDKGTYTKAGPAERIGCFFEYLKLAEKNKIDFLQIKLNANYFTRSVPGGAKLRFMIGKAKTAEEITGILERYKKESSVGQ